MSESVLIVGVNWLGDSVMAMPAIQAYRRAEPDARLTMMAKPKCRDIWSLHADIDEIIVCPESVEGTFRAVRAARERMFGTAFIMPHSFRSALVPFLARVPRRLGLTGHHRDWMLTEVIDGKHSPDKTHQCHEYMNLFGLRDVAPDRPKLTVPNALKSRGRELTGPAGGMRAALMPGAAYGPAKRWPAERFAEVGKLLNSAFGAVIPVLGSEAEREICANVAAAVGESAVNLAGRTSLVELAAVLACCDVVIANDSGGMHLASAVGTPVTAIFGITDPEKTGPLGQQVRVLQDSEIKSRDLERESGEAEARLRRISPQQVFEAASSLLSQEQ